MTAIRLDKHYKKVHKQKVPAKQTWTECFGADCGACAEVACK